MIKTPIYAEKVLLLINQLKLTEQISFEELFSIKMKSIVFVVLNGTFVKLIPRDNLLLSKKAAD